MRVLQADGKVLYFADPILAIQVMQEHPGHLVVRCGPSSMLNEMIWGGKYTSLTYDKIRQMSSSKHSFAMLRADEQLDSKSTYFLLPIKAKKQLGAWSHILRALKASTKIAPGEIDQRSDSWGPLEKKLSLLRRSRSVPRSREPVQPVKDKLLQHQQEQHQHQHQHQQKQQQKLTPSVSFPGRSVNLYPRNPFMEGVGRGPLPTLQNKRPRRPVQKPSQFGWKPILESISEGVDDFSDDEDYSGHFHRTQSKYPRRLHSCNSHPESLRTTANLRPVAV